MKITWESTGDQPIHVGNNLDLPGDVPLRLHLIGSAPGSGHCDVSIIDQQDNVLWQGAITEGDRLSPRVLTMAQVRFNGNGYVYYLWVRHCVSNTEATLGAIGSKLT